ncbi:MAG: DNA mismatch repair protein MutS [Rhodobacteraceae bacterium]|nr:MAG: DNA mismatch repair protein MutS [Paracoccaceae bacterium]
MTRKRRVRPDEAELWGQVARTAIPMPGRKPAAPPRPAPRTKEIEPPARPDLPQFSMGQKAQTAAPRTVLAPSISDELAGAPVAMDKKAFTRLKRGKLKPEARIDLHGMTLERAHPALIGFIQRTAAQDLRLVLVITGKGKRAPDDGPMPQRRGVLRHQVPHWLRMAPVGHLVLQVSEAHLRHGGGGAYYVYLRRRR